MSGELRVEWLFLWFQDQKDNLMNDIQISHTLNVYFCWYVIFYAVVVVFSYFCHHVVIVLLSLPCGHYHDVAEIILTSWRWLHYVMIKLIVVWSLLMCCCCYLIFVMSLLLYHHIVVVIVLLSCDCHHGVVNMMSTSWCGREVDCCLIIVVKNHNDSNDKNYDINKNNDNKK